MNAEDIKSRLLFSDSCVQSRAVFQLVEVVRKKKPHDKLISSDSSQVPELNLLWEVCSSDSFTASSISIDGLISLVLQDCIQFEYAVNKIINVITSSNKPAAALSGLVKLLVYNLSKDRNISSKYSLQYPKHPFIVILENKPEVWPILLDVIFDTISKGGSKEYFQVMEPIISYILFRPNLGLELKMMPNVMLSKFVLFGEKHPLAAVKYFCDILPYMQMRDPVEIQCAMNIIAYISHLLPYCNNLDDLSINLEVLVFAALSIAQESLGVGINSVPTLDVALNICSHLPNSIKSVPATNACFVLLSVMFQENCLSVLDKLLCLCVELFDKYPPSKIITSMLIVPLLKILSDPKILSSTNDSLQFVSSFLKNLESHFNQTTDESSSESYFHNLEALNYSASQSFICGNFIFKLSNMSSEDVISYLDDFKHQICGDCTISRFQFSLIAGLFIMADSLNILEKCLELLEVISEIKPDFSTNMLAILLYKLTLEPGPECSKLIMEYVPKTAVHKYAAGPVLNMLQMMSKNQELKPQVIYLFLQLWKKQKRCFPYLQKLLVENDETLYTDTGLHEVRIAQSLAIMELCSEASEAYGGEFLNALSAIINKSSNESGTPAVLLSLKAISDMCKAEALDLRSAWKTLAPKLTRDKRPSVTVHVCQFLSLVPVLKVNSFQYEKFMNEIASHLWRLVSNSSNSPSIISAAFVALSKFPLSCHNLKELPMEAKTNLKLPASMMATPYEAARFPEDVLTYIPGYCFVDYLKNTTNITVLQGYEKFLESIIKQEISDLPRGIYVQQKTIGKKHNATDVFSNVPGFLCAQYEVRKSLNDRKNTTVGILLSYEPPVEMDKEGKPLKRSIALHLRQFEQILAILIKEVNLDCIEWQRCLLLPHGWALFMERAFFACEESRRANIKLQQSSGQLKESPDEVSVLLDTSWLWLRDRFFDLIKIHFGDSSTSAANSIFALSGLISAAEKFYSGLDEKTKEISNSCKKYMNHELFQMQLVETIISVLDPSYRPATNIFGWLLSPSSKQSTSSSSLIRGTAAASLCNLRTVILRCFPDKVPYLYTVLFRNLTKDSSSVLSLYTGMGLGLFLQSLCQEGYEDSSKEKVQWILNAAEDVKSSCTSENLKLGNLVALTYTVVSMSMKGKSAYADWVKEICYDFYERFQKEKPSSMTYEYLSICTSCIMISAGISNILPLTEIQAMMHCMLEKTQQMPQCSGSAICLGVLLDALICLNDTSIEETLEKVKRNWINVLGSENEPTLQRIAALNGLCGLYSAGRGIIKLNSTCASRMYGLKDFVLLLHKLLSNSKDSSIQQICVWELGRLYSVNNREVGDGTIAPSNYSYLSDRSTLKPLLQLLIGDNLENCTPHQIKVILNCLSCNFSRPLPPLNWAIVLTPVLQKRDDLLTETSLLIALRQMATSTNALSLIISHTLPPLILSLSENCILLLAKNIQLLASSLPPANLKPLLHHLIIDITDNFDKFNTVSVTSLQGLYESHKQLSSNNAVIEVLEETFSQLLKELIRHNQLFHQHLILICRIFSQISKESQCSILADLKKSDNLSIVFLIVCRLVRDGSKPLEYLKPYLEHAKYVSYETKQTIISLLVKCFAGALPESNVKKPERCVAFLYETIGWIKISTDPKHMSDISTKNILFLFNVCLSIMVGSSGLNVCYIILEEDDIDSKSLLKILPHALLELMKIPEWDASMDKVIELLLQVRTSMPSENQYYIQSALCALRISNSFSKSPLWAEIPQRSVMNK